MYVNRYLIQRLGIPVREAVICITNARNHEIERKQYLDELERHTSLLPKDSSCKDILFSRMRSGGGVPGHAARIASPAPSSSRAPPENWRAELKPRRSKSPSEVGGISRSNFNGQIMDMEPRMKESRDIPRKYSPGFPPEKYDMRYREGLWEKESDRSGRGMKQSRERDMRGTVETKGGSGGGDEYGIKNRRSRERELAPSRGPVDNRAPGRDQNRDMYEERYRHRASPPSAHYDNRSIIEEARRSYRSERPSAPMNPIETPRGYQEDFIRFPSRDRPLSPHFDPPIRGDRYSGGDRFRDERAPILEYGRGQLRSPSPRYRGRFSPHPLPYARGAMESGDMPYMPNRRIEEQNRPFEPDLPVGGRRMESDMPVGSRRMNDIFPDGPSQRLQMNEDMHGVRRRVDNAVGRGRMDADISTIRGGLEVERERGINREMGEPYRDRREIRRSPSPGRARLFVDNYGPRGGEAPPYGMGQPVSVRYDSPVRPSGRDPVLEGDMRRRPPSPPRQPWYPEPEWARMGEARMGPSEAPPYRDYGPSRRQPSFRGADEPPPPGIEAEMRRAMEERGRKRSPVQSPPRAKVEMKSNRSRSISRRSESGSRGKLRSVSPRKIRHSKNVEPNNDRGLHMHGEDRMSSGWPLSKSPSRPPAPSPGAQLPGCSWMDDHPPVRSRIADGPDCRLIINQKRSAVFPDEHEGSPPNIRGSIEERRHISPSIPPPMMEHGRNINEIRSREGPRMKDVVVNRGMRGSRSDRGVRPRRGIDSKRGLNDRLVHRGRPSEESKKPVFDRLDIRRGSGPWQR